MDYIIERLFELVSKSLELDDFPVSAIIYDDDYNIISEGYNRRNKTNKTIDHAEIIAICKANEKTKSWRLENLNMIVSLEPCSMCNNVIKESRLKKVEYIIPRLKYKKINNKTIFQKKDFCNDNLMLKWQEYNRIISNFFVDKR